MKKENIQILVLCTIVLLGALTRLIHLPSNFTAIGAIALFAGANFKNKKLAYIVPILSMMLADLFLPFGFNFIIYACFIGIVWIGTRISTNQSVKNILVGSLSGSILFYLITNLPFLYTNPRLYTNDISGYLTSLVAAFPFFTNSLMGDLFFNGVLFGSYYLLKRKIAILA